MISCVYFKHLPLALFTSSTYLFNVISRDFQTTERKQKVDLKATEGAWNNTKFNEIGLILSSKSTTDAPTKATADEDLESLVNTNNLHQKSRLLITALTSPTAPFASSRTCTIEFTTAAFDLSSPLILERCKFEKRYRLW